LGIFQENPDLLRDVRDIVAISPSEIWLASGFPDVSGASIFRFDSQTDEFTPFPVSDPHGNRLFPDDLLLTRAGSLWALFGSRSYSLLARLDPAKGRFEVVTDKDHLLDPAQMEQPPYFTTSNSLLAEEPDGTIIVVLNGQIYHYDPTTNSARLLLRADSGLEVESIAVSKDGNVWFTSGQDLAVRELDLSDGLIWYYGPPPGMTELDAGYYAVNWMRKPFEVDSAGRVWVSDFGWLQRIDGSKRYAWHVNPRSAVFISIYDSEFLYMYDRPLAAYQLSDGDLWFTTFWTTVLHDPETNKWCWTATAGGPLAEDALGNVWLIDQLGPQIYRYAFNLGSWPPDK